MNGEREAALMLDLGFRPPSPAEQLRLAVRRAIAGLRAKSRAEGGFVLPAAVLNADPLVSYCGIVQRAPLGLASIAPSGIRKRDAWFLISPTWTLEEPAVVRMLRRRAVAHRLRHPHHRLIFLCNTPEEVALLQEQGEAASFLNKTLTVPEAIFRPIEGTPVEFDAIYNAQLAPWKRHELSLGIERCAFMFYRDASGRQEFEAALFARHARLAPGHVFLNATDGHGVPVRLPPADVNRQLARAAVGLCLSAREGAMFASTEYLLAGLPIVSTPSAGGRHIHFDPDYCLTVPPDPRLVAEAVAAMKARGIPRGHIRERVLQRLDRDRTRFIDLINRVLAASGATSRLAMPWPFRKPVTMEWFTAELAVERAASGRVDGFETLAEADRAGPSGAITGGGSSTGADIRPAAR